MAAAASPSTPPPPLSPPPPPTTVAAITAITAIAVEPPPPPLAPASKSNPASSSEWNDEAVSCLLDKYLEKFSAARGYLRTKDWEEVVGAVNQVPGSDGLSKVSKTVKQCRDKIDSLKRRYKIEKRKPPFEVVWPFFHRLEEMMSSLAAFKQQTQHYPSPSAYPNPYTYPNPNPNPNLNPNPNPNHNPNLNPNHNLGLDPNLNPQPRMLCLDYPHQGKVGVGRAGALGSGKPSHLVSFKYRSASTEDEDNDFYRKYNNRNNNNDNGDEDEEDNDDDGGEDGEEGEDGKEREQSRSPQECTAGNSHHYNAPYWEDHPPEKRKSSKSSSMAPPEFDISDDDDDDEDDDNDDDDDDDDGGFAAVVYPPSLARPSGAQGSTPPYGESRRSPRKRKPSRSHSSHSNTHPIQAMANAVTGFAHVFAQIELAKMEIFAKMEVEMAKLAHGSRKKRRGDSRKRARTTTTATKKHGSSSFTGTSGSQ